jgi:type III secretion protein U
MSDEKTEEPTEKKLRDAREKKGQSPKSQDVNAAVSVLGGLICLMAAGGYIFDGVSKVISLTFDDIPRIANSNAHINGIIFDMVIQGALIIVPSVMTAFFLGLIASFGQVGFHLSFEPITPNFDKVNPGSGIKKLISVKSLIEFAKMVFKAIALTWVLWIMIKGLIPLLVGTAYINPFDMGSIGWNSILKLIGAGSIVFIIIGPIDFGLQLWLFYRDQRMTKDEIKREYKEMEGDPQIKQQRKQLAHEMATTAPQKKVPGSSVVVTNPTHYSVALYYEAGKTPLPIVVAKGIDAEAMLIREIAEQHHIPLVGNPPLARALHKIRIDDPVPEELFEAVAAVLRWVSALNAMDMNPLSDSKGKNT